MYQRIWRDYLSRIKSVPLERTLYLGQAMRFIREENRMTRTSVAQEANIGLSLLKSMESKKETYTTWENVTNLARALNVPLESFTERAREEFPGNFYLQRKEGGLRMDYDGITICPLSPPLSTQNDFLMLRIRLDPNRSMAPCTHPRAHEIACYVTEGPLKFSFGSKTYELKANQSFFFDGFVQHGFFNENDTKAIEFFLCVNPPPAEKETAEGKASTRKEGLDLAFALEYVRRKASPVSNIPLPWNMLSEMTQIPLRALMHLKSGKTEIVYWDKLEALAQGTGIPLKEIVDVALGKIDGRFEICSALYRGYLDYGDQFGMRIYSAVRPGTGQRKFFIGQVLLNKRGALRSVRSRWRYQTNAFMCAVVQDGRIFMEYGKQKKETLEPGDSVYFNADVEFVVHNLEHQDSRLFLFTQPPLF